MYKYKQFIDSTMVDHNLNIKLSTIFALFQKAATDHSEILNIGKANTLDKGMYWVLTRYHVEILSYPKYLNTVVVKTFADTYNKFVFNRKFLIEDNKGHILIKASSVWCVLSKKNHQVVMDPFKGIKIKEDKIPFAIDEPIKIEHLETNIKENRKVRYTDLDLNGHVNNTKYIDYIVDSHDKDFYSHHLISSIMINYKKELLMGDEFTVSHDNELFEHICISTNDKQIMEAIIQYIKK